MAYPQSRMTARPGLKRWMSALVLVCLLPLSTLRAADILLAGAQDSPGVQEFAEALASRRPHDSVRFTPLGQLPAASKLPATTRLILLDLPSLDWRLQDRQGPPTLVMRITRLQAHQRLGKNESARLSFLWSDPPLGRQLRLIKAVLPQALRIGVLYGEQSSFLLPELRHHARSLGLEIIAQRWDDIGDSRPLQDLLKSSDALLGLDDPELYNPKTAKNLLLSSYARQLPLIGPNAGFVKAGSLVSSYSDQDDWLQILDHLLDNPPATWPWAMYSPHFKVLSNPQVARSLGIEPIDEVAVANELSKGEQRP